MTDEQFIENDETIAEDFNLLDWIKTGTIAKREVTIYIDHDAATEYADVLKEIAKIDPDDLDIDGDVPLGHADPAVLRLEELRDRQAILEDALRDARMVWTVRAVSRDEIDAVFEAVPAPRPPLPAKENLNAAAQEKFLARVEGYNKAKAKCDEERQLRLLAVSVMSIETRKGIKDSVSLDELKALRGRPHGQQWITLLTQAMDAATGAEAAPPVPTLPGDSTASRG